MFERCRTLVAARFGAEASSQNICTTSTSGVGNIASQSKLHVSLGSHGLLSQLGIARFTLEQSRLDKRIHDDVASSLKDAAASRLFSRSFAAQQSVASACFKDADASKISESRAQQRRSTSHAPALSARPHSDSADILPCLATRAFSGPACRCRVLYGHGAGSGATHRASKHFPATRLTAHYLSQHVRIGCLSRTCRMIEQYTRTAKNRRNSAMAPPWPSPQSSTVQPV